MVADSRRRVADLSEIELLDEILGVLGNGEACSGVVVGPGDDAAVLAMEGQVVVTTDSQHQGVHWNPAWFSARQLGCRAIAVNASDLGAMGAAPRGFLVALALPPDTPLDWVRELAGGLRMGAERFAASVVGGDVTAVPNRPSINVTAVGERHAEAAGQRGGAHIGDELFVTGRPGRAAAGRALLMAGAAGGDAGAAIDGGIAAGGEAAASAGAAAGGQNEGATVGGGAALCIEAFRNPRPPVSFGVAVATAGAVGAMLDVSDGLAIDLHRLCRASGVGAELDISALLADAALREAAGAAPGAAAAFVLAGGEDYQLLCAVPPDRAARFAEIAAACDIVVARVGRVVERAAGVTRAIDGRQEPLAAVGWDPFSSST